jgi:phasin
MIRVFYWPCPTKGIPVNQGSVIHFSGTRFPGRGVRNGHIKSSVAKDYTSMTNPSDPFSASIIPFEVPEQMRAFAEKGVSQARDSYAKFKDAAETHNSTVEAVFTTVNKGATEYSAKLIEFFKANTTSSLDFAQELFGVKSPSEAVELWTSHARKQFETFTAQAKELAELGQKVAADAAEPIKASASKYYKPAA